jgi:hypothetical protein
MRKGSGNGVSARIGKKTSGKSSARRSANGKEMEKKVMFISMDNWCLRRNFEKRFLDKDT